MESVANLLIEKRLVLTALELHTELLERGKEVKELKDYFSNPGNFEQAIPQPLSSIKSDIGEGGIYMYVCTCMRVYVGVPPLTICTSISYKLYIIQSTEMLYYICILIFL